MAQKKTVESPAIQLLDHVWEHSMKAVEHSWLRLNSTMQTALSLAISGGLTFDEGDFNHIVNNYSSGYWLGEMETWYSRAVQESNTSAYLSYEQWANRPPFIADNVILEHTRNAHCEARNFKGERVKERLAVGFQFVWNHQIVTVTSFAKDGTALTACSYKATGSEYDRKINRRYSITVDDIRADRAERKRRGELEAELKAVAEKQFAGDTSKILETLGVKTRDEYESLPVAKIEKALSALKA